MADDPEIEIRVVTLTKPSRRLWGIKFDWHTGRVTYSKVRRFYNWCRALLQQKKEP